MTEVHEQLVETLGREKLLAIIRGSDPQGCIATAQRLADAGIRLMEISLTSADALNVLSAVRDSIGDQVLLGAGTVLSTDDVDAAVSHGAHYMVTPAVTGSVAYAAERGLPVLCGALTPTEMFTALEQGATAVKVFPAGRMGPGYLKDLRGPFPDMPLIPVGGIGAEQAPEYLAAGALAVGVASPLCGDAPNGGSLDDLDARAAQFLQAVGS